MCCGKNSALEDDAVLSESLSLKELSPRLQGRHLPNDDGHPIVLTAEYVPQISINSGLIVGALQDQHALLIEWKSHLYVLYGAIFGETRYSSGMRQYSIHKLLLLDPRFSDQRRETEFNRETDDWGTIHGFLRLAVVRQQPCSSSVCSKIVAAEPSSDLNLLKHGFASRCSSMFGWMKSIGCYANYGITDWSVPVGCSRSLAAAYNFVSICNLMCSTPQPQCA